MNAPVVITSLGAFGVKVGAPIVVPPSVGTLFVGTAHQEIIPNGKKNETAEVITLSLTFDHRVVNGAGAANFVHDIKEQIEQFKIPSDGSRRIRDRSLRIEQDVSGICAKGLPRRTPVLPTRAHSRKSVSKSSREWPDHCHASG